VDKITFVRDGESEFGWLCVCNASRSYNEPELVLQHWPFTERTFERRLDMDLVGLEVAYRGNGVFHGRDRNAVIVLLDGGQTKPVKTERVPIPRPKTPLECRYERGRWEKRTVKGWVPAE